LKVDLPGIAKVSAKGRTYYYAWRGGPRLRGEPGSPEFVTSYQEAHENGKTPNTGRFCSLIALYKASQDYRNLADTTKRQWAPWLDRLGQIFGDTSIKQFDRPEKMTPILRKWRNKYAETPRTADYGLQVLSRVLSYAVDPLGKISRNPCEGIKQLYSVDRSQTIWTDADVARLKATCSQEIAHAVDLAAHTGLRLSDLLRLSWSHVRENHIAIATGKSKQRREALIPLYDDLRDVLAHIPKRSTAVLTNSLHRPWTSDGFGSSFNKAKIAAGMNDADLHFHDLRGTAATRFYLANLSEREIAEIMGWEEEHVARIVKRYVDRTAAIMETIRRLNERRT
jgi:integrase